MAVLISSGTLSKSASDTTITPAIPGTYASGDTLVLVAGHRNSGTPSITAPVGWTAIGSETTGSEDIYAYYKVAGASESDPTWTTSIADTVWGYVDVWRDAGTVTFADTDTFGLSDSPRTLPVQTATGEQTCVFHVVLGSNSTPDIEMTSAAGFTESRDESSLTGAGTAHYTGWKNVSAGSVTLPTVELTVGLGSPSANAIIFLMDNTPSVSSGVADALIEVDVTNDPRSGVTTWTDVTAYATGTVTITRGRQDELSDQLSPATCTFTLDNSDGRFTPDLTSGPYGSGFRKGIQVRVSVDLDATTYRRFRGYVDTIDGPSWPGGVTEQSFVQLTCSDELAQWSKGRKLKDVLTETLLRDDPDAYYPLTDGELVDESGLDQKRLTIESRSGGGTAGPDIKGNGFGGISLGGNTLSDGIAYLIENAGQTRDLNREGSAQKNWRGGSFAFRQGAQGGHNYLERALTIATSDRWALGAWCRLQRDSDGNGGWVAYLKNGSRYLAVGYNSAGEARASVYDATTVANVTQGRLTNNDWHHILVHYTRGGNIELFLDGKSKGTTAAQNWDNSTANPTLWVGSGLYGGASTYYGIQKGNVAHVTVYSGDNADDAATNVADHYEAGWNGFQGARTGEMLDRLIGWMKYPGGTAVDSGVTVVGDEFPQGSTALEYAQLLIDSEAGTLYTSGDGTITFHQRSHRYNNTSNVLTVSSYHDPATGFRTDDQYLVNRARYNMPNGKGGTSTAPASVSDYGPYERTWETLIRHEDQAELLAEFATYRWKNPDARLLSFPVNILTSPTSLGVAALGTEIDDRVQMTNLPDQAPASTVDGYVEGWTETFGTPETDVFEITFNTSPTYTISDSFVLNSASLGQLNEEKLYY